MSESDVQPAVDDQAERLGRVFSVPELCAVLGYERHTIYKMIRTGHLPAIKCGSNSRPRVREIDVIKAFKSQQAPNIRRIK